MTLRGTGYQGNSLRKTGYQGNTKAAVFEGAGAASVPTSWTSRSSSRAQRLWSAFVAGGEAGRARGLCTLCPAPARRPFFLHRVQCWYSSRIPHPRTPCASCLWACTPSHVPPTGLAAPRGRPSLRCRSSRAVPGAKGPLNCSQNGWRLDQLICKTGVNHLIRGPHAGREPTHLLCSEVAAPAACLSGEMEIRRRTKPPRGQAAPSAALGGVVGRLPRPDAWTAQTRAEARRRLWPAEPVAVCLEATHGPSLAAIPSWK